MDWYYHAPGHGRVGPLTAASLREHYRERRIAADTLVWRDGLREWQPLERVADELGLDGVAPDLTRPPPLPPVISPAVPGMLSRPLPSARPESRRLSGCLMAVVAVGVLAVPLLGILAAIAIPAYQDYVLRTRVASAIGQVGAPLRPAVLEARDRLGRCAHDVRELQLGAALPAGIRVGELEAGRCAFELTIVGLDERVDGRSLLFAAPAGPTGAWDCTGGDLPPAYRPRACRAEKDTTE